MHQNFGYSSWDYPVKHPQAIADPSPQLGCSDCCDECSAPFTPQCNEKCMIVPCNNPEFSGTACHLLNEDCENVDCVSTIIPDCRSHHNRNDCGGCYGDYSFDADGNTNYKAEIGNTFQMDTSIDQFLYHRQPQHPAISPSSSPSAGSSTSSNADFIFNPKDPAIMAGTGSISGPPMPPMICMWGDCQACFSSMSELVGHVNVVHLQPSTQRLPKANSISDLPLSPLQCQWRDCHAPHPQVPFEQMFTSPDALDNILSMLTDHLMQDHLKASSRPPASLSGQFLDGHLQVANTTEHDPSKSTETHPCRWHSCSDVFSSLDDLTMHISSLHVGSGKAQYECFWEGCTRNGAHGFSSKQKICRHIQSHTGHRPFQCKICNQNFSEAATLQQHMRRHTHEKPYVCDYPGCKKSFAIAGALTIHKRVHNGEKPFKCKYCDKAFAESSNLSKHLRTHTGVRPYTCTETGCGKSFARPDQLTRHALIHKKQGPS